MVPDTDTDSVPLASLPPTSASNSGDSKSTASGATPVQGMLMRTENIPSELTDTAAKFQKNARSSMCGWCGDGVQGPGEGA